MTVLLGCPTGIKLAFDPDASKNATGKEHFCTPVDGVPCFYFYRGKLLRRPYQYSTQDIK